MTKVNEGHSANQLKQAETAHRDTSSRYMKQAEFHLSGKKKQGADPSKAEYNRKMGEKHNKARSVAQSLRYRMQSQGASHTSKMTKEELTEGEMSHDARELVLHADNTHDLHRQSKEPIQKNLVKKHKKGTYDHEKAKKLWGYHADRAAMSYHREHGDKHQPWHKMFPKHVRKEAAHHWADEHHEEMKAGEHDHLLKKESIEIVDATTFDKPLDVAEIFAQSIAERAELIVAEMKDDMRLTVFKKINESDDKVKEGQNDEKDSAYQYKGKHKESGLHIFQEPGSKPELFAQRKHRHSGWGLKHKGKHYEFVRSHKE